MVTRRTEVGEGIIVDVRWEGGGLTVVVILRECLALRAEKAAPEEPVQIIAEKGAQIRLGRIFADGTYGFPILTDKPLRHQLVLDAPTQIDRDMVVRCDLVHGQLLFAQTIEMPRCFVHYAIVEILGRVTVLHQWAPFPLSFVPAEQKTVQHRLHKSGWCDGKSVRRDRLIEECHGTVMV